MWTGSRNQFGAAQLKARPDEEAVAHLRPVCGARSLGVLSSGLTSQCAPLRWGCAMVDTVQLDTVDVSIGRGAGMVGPKDGEHWGELFVFCGVDKSSHASPLSPHAAGAPRRF